MGPDWHRDYRRRPPQQHVIQDTNNTSCTLMFMSASVRNLPPWQPDLMSEARVSTLHQTRVFEPKGNKLRGTSWSRGSCFYTDCWPSLLRVRNDREHDPIVRSRPFKFVPEDRSSEADDSEETAQTVGRALLLLATSSSVLRAVGTSFEWSKGDSSRKTLTLNLKMTPQHPSEGLTGGFCYLWTQVGSPCWLTVITAGCDWWFFLLRS